MFLNMEGKFPTQRVSFFMFICQLKMPEFPDDSEFENFSWKSWSKFAVECKENNKVRIGNFDEFFFQNQRFHLSKICIFNKVGGWKISRSLPDVLISFAFELLNKKKQFICSSARKFSHWTWLNCSCNALKKIRPVTTGRFYALHFF